MTKVQFALSDFKNQGLSLEDLEKAVPGIGMEVDGASDESIKIDITPNRPDLLSFDGLVNAALMYLGRRKPDAEKYTSPTEAELSIQVDPSVRRRRPFIAGIVVHGANLSGKRFRYLIDFSEKLSDGYGRKRAKLALGIHNLKSIKGEVRYLAGKDSFVPLGRREKMDFDTTIRELEKGKEYSHIVADKSGNYPYLRDSEKVLSLIPIINSEASKIDPKSGELFIDVTGISQAAVNAATDILACSFIMGGAKIGRVEVKYGWNGKSDITPHLEVRSESVGLHYIQKSLGFYLDGNRIAALSERMGHISYIYGKKLIVKSAPYRTDILSAQDIVEDIAMAYGFDRIDPLPVAGYSFGSVGRLTEMYELASEIMVGMGYTEVINNYLTSSEACFYKMGRQFDKNSTISVEYSKTENMSMLRDIVLPSLMGNLSSSSKEPLPISIFEFGSAFRMDGRKANEMHKLAFAKENSRVNIAEAAAVVKEFCIRFYGMEPEFRSSEEPFFIKGRCSEIILDGESIGKIGEISPTILRNFLLSDPVCAGEIRIFDLKEATKGHKA
ncbi:MAG: phenylalanine--tRNA ligase subunit beta [Candidatus Micrarchaeaceae archaeon]